MAERTTLFINANVHTVDEGRPHATWFTTLGDRLQALGTGPAPKASKTVDLKGRTVVPGFVDSHIHFFQTGLDRLFIDLGGCPSLEALAERLIAGASGKRGWVFAHSFEEDALEDVERLTRHELDAIMGDRPVWIGRIDYHSAVVNSAALKRLELSRGLKGLLVDEGEPNGILRAEAYLEGRERVQRQYPVWVRERAVKEAVRACVARGITAVHALEGGRLFGDEGVHVLLSKMDRLPLDLTLFLQEKNVFFTKQLGFEHLGGCILVDGSIGSYTAAIDGGYHACGTSQVSTYESVRSLLPFIQAAHNAGAQLAFHAIGERAIDVVLDCYERALLKNPRYDHRHRIEHFELATDAQIARAASLGVCAAMQPAFEHCWGGPDGMYAQRIGERWRQTNRLRSILDGGVRIAGGSDANVTPPDPLLGMQAAVRHPNEAQRVTAAEALKMMTLDAAWAGGNERRHGSLAPGKEASFAVLDADPLVVAPETISGIRVLETWSRGRMVHTAGASDPEWDTETLGEGDANASFGNG
jgi:predicted amidohydrolase YtcJ